MENRRNPPYWLAEGTEICEGCSHFHILQVELRCSGCDGAFCEHCVLVVRATREILCATCAPAPAVA